MGELFVSDLEKIKNLIFFDPQAPVVNVAMPTSLDDPRIPLWIRARKATQKIGGKPYLHDPQLASRLDRVQCPTRILWGREDRLIPLTHGQYFAEHIPQATLKIFAQTGHMLPHERPAEFAAEVHHFLTPSLGGQILNSE